MLELRLEFGGSGLGGCVVGWEGGQMGKAGGWQARSTSYICDVSTPIKQ